MNTNTQSHDDQLIYTISDVLNLLHFSRAGFWKHKPALEARGFPRPLPLPGHPRYLRQAVVDWLVAAQDAPPLPAPAPDPAKPRRGRPRKLAQAQAQAEG